MSNKQDAMIKYDAIISCTIVISIATVLMFWIAAIAYCKCLELKHEQKKIEGRNEKALQ